MAAALGPVVAQAANQLKSRGLAVPASAEGKIAELFSGKAGETKLDELVRDQTDANANRGSRGGMDKSSLDRSRGSSAPP